MRALENPKFKFSRKSFIDGLTSFTLFPQPSKVKKTTPKRVWSDVWKSFSAASENLSKVIYEQTSEED